MLILKRNYLKQGAQMTKNALILIIIVILNSGTYATALGDAAAAMAPGEWRQLQTTGLTRSFLETTANPAYPSILQYAAKAEWDPNSEQFLFVGSGHDNAYKMIIYSAATNSWRTGPLPAACMNRGNYSGGCSAHSYYYSAMDAANGKYYWALPWAGTIGEYDVAGNSWRNLSGSTSNLRSYGGLAYFPERNGFVYARGDSPSAIWYNKPNSQWTSLSGFYKETYHMFAVYNPVHKMVQFGGGNGNRDVYMMNEAGSVSRQTTAPVNIGTGGGTVTVDPVTGNLLLFDGKGEYEPAGSPVNFYEYDVSGDKWTKLPNPPTAINTSFPTNLGFAVAPVSNYGVLMYLTYSPTGVYLYKHAESATIARPGADARSADNITIRPNPFTRSIRISFSRVQEVSEGFIYDLAGKRVHAFRNPGKAGIVWKADSRSSQVYILKVRSGKKQYVRRLFFQK
jgi:hypothetical protein